MTLRVGTRGSALALAQTRALLADVPDVELVTVTSHGDRSTASLASLGGTGVFVTALRDALLAGDVDAVVHSCKDLPTAPHEEVELLALPARADARDVLVGAGDARLADLPVGARVGTGSPRRRAQLLRARPDLDVADIRGNVDTRLRRVQDPRTPEERLDAVVLAAAGLDRLGRLGEASELLDLVAWPTAPAQGALAVEVRRDAPPAVRDAVAALDDPATRRAATAERIVLRLLEAGCAAPLGVSVTGGELVAEAYALDGARAVRATAPLGAAGAGNAPAADGVAVGEADPESVARDVVAALLRDGAAGLLS
ncbi:hydroxymethylbilane synthase [Miniimonas sp. S16]|uniref:hydroxymethylbilane synthase n=1 Tax=Miniimonas sp. S16 TaxID=2171623 RepID=UPI000D527974|nr:hydroxymethylbilane synthase [Miniimonas sp. S16]